MKKDWTIVVRLQCRSDICKRKVKRKPNGARSLRLQCKSDRQLEGELQSEDHPVDESCIAQKWPGPIVPLLPRH